MKRKMSALLLLVSMCLSLTSSALAANDISTTKLDVTNGRFVSMEAAPAQAALNTFFETRNYASGEVLSIPNADGLSAISDEVADDISARTLSLKELWADEDVEIVSTSVTGHVLSAVQNTKDASIDAIAYEWTWVDYIDSNCGIVDRMGFGTLHDMTLATAEDGAYSIVRDSYNEADISGHVSKDYNAEAFELATAGIDTTDIYMSEVAKEEGLLKSEAYSVAAVAATETKMPAPLECIKYADEWVEHDIYSTPSAVPKYNPVFSYHASNDCCNFVSQCVYTGGFEMDRKNGWYHDMNSTTSHGAAWGSVSAFRSYWMTTRGFQEVTATDTSVLPGNPVYWIKELDHKNDPNYSGNHIAICVGYNAAGNPIINGHTRNVYHEKLNTSAYKRTLKLNQSNPFIVAPKAATAVQIPGLNNLYLQAGKAEFFKFTAPSNGYFTVYTSGSTDTYGYLYEGQSAAGSAGTIYLKEISHNGDAWGGINCRFGGNLTANKTYYIMICGEEATSSGSYNLMLQAG